MMRFPLRVPMLALVTVFSPAGLSAQSADPVMLDMDQVEWVEIVPGVDFGDVYGVFTEGAHGKLVRFEPGLESPPHTHSQPYHGMVLQGTVMNPYRDEADPPRMEVGDYFYVPGGMEHVTACVSEEPCLFYTHSDYAWDIEIVE
ncbi:MAG TPA: cupin domain-containing protein [Gemmatimonadota bacterium]|nr:cupin domain-containing protein [Gemmatimonadota bacterium]